MREPTYRITEQEKAAVWSLLRKASTRQIERELAKMDPGSTGEVRKMFANELKDRDKARQNTLGGGR